MSTRILIAVRKMLKRQGVSNVAAMWLGFLITRAERLQPTHIMCTIYFVEWGAKMTYVHTSGPEHENKTRGPFTTTVKKFFKTSLFRKK
jgi:hypothetical protein